ncbi:ABC transporter permease subunit [Cytobacillus gottheilii]|uniref:ABC transporter permease subunit n=1 Tax=Cytobacillus gottheilii TaxID=859144 RepID=A0ABX8FC04_9BACI|nr:ABC transporter permease subunit [Cytobacillus gottheilii]QVY61744.1 ABC transporter permease subunit [Cytobacillus gottheilii]
MFVISKREFFSLFKSIKSIIIIAILLATAYYSSKFSNALTNLVDFTADEMNYVHTIGLLSLLLLFGQLFVLGLSHDCINRETHERTMRFLVTRTSRLSILFGKFLGIVLFWTVCVTISFLIISIFARQFDFFSFFQVMSLLIYQISLTILLSTIIPKPGITMFLGILLGIAFPIFGMWITFTSNEWVSWLKYVTPFYYLEHDNYLFLIINLLAAFLLFISAAIFTRREF